jgi:glutathione synthase/RimK-type ligase-like ATP-grasp enzyme
MTAQFDSQEQFDAVWNRRPRRASIPDSIHPDDRAIVEEENVENYRGMWSVVGRNAFWVNPRVEAAIADNKLLQLDRATALGFCIPETLVSNDLDDIRAFVRDNAKDGVIYKGFGTQAWKAEGGGVIRVHTTEIVERNLLSADVMRLTPGIFQRKLSKKFEIRATVMGEEFFAIRIDSQAHPDGKTDWRSAPTNELSMSRFELPSAIQKKCLELMRSYGIVFGCFDFIVDQDDRYVFLEVNQTGQFLWVEQQVSDMPLLSTFCEFLVEQNPAYRRSRLHHFPIHFSEVLGATAYQEQHISEMAYLKLKPGETRVL